MESIDDSVRGRIMAQRHYLPVGVSLLKHVAARPGALICRRDATVTIDGRRVATAKSADSHGRPLPVWRGCHVLRDGELFLLNAAPDSFDGRYFGAVPAAGLLGRATPILTRDTPNAPPYPALLYRLDLEVSRRDHVFALVVPAAALALLSFVPFFMRAEGGARLGLGRIVVLHCCSSTLYRNR